MYPKMKMYKKTLTRIQNFNFIRDIPYRLPLSFEEPDYCCEGKHIVLKTLLENTGLEVRPRICYNLWSSLKVIPKAILEIPHEDEICHLYLEARIDGKWCSIDASLDKDLEQIIEVFEWDGKTSTGICVYPTYTYSPKKSLELFNTEWSKEDFEEDIQINGKFYKAINDWLEGIRRDHK